MAQSDGGVVAVVGEVTLQALLEVGGLVTEN